jgi:hypothetical protein
MSKSNNNDLIKFVKDANDLVKILTGKSIPELGIRAGQIFGEDIAKKLVSSEQPLSEDSPYSVLGVRHDASSLVVKAKFRTLVMGKSHGELEYIKYRDAYSKILSERGEG